MPKSPKIEGIFEELCDALTVPEVQDSVVWIEKKGSGPFILCTENPVGVFSMLDAAYEREREGRAPYLSSSSPLFHFNIRDAIEALHGTELRFAAAWQVGEDQPTIAHSRQLSLETATWILGMVVSTHYRDQEEYV